MTSQILPAAMTALERRIRSSVAHPTELAALEADIRAGHICPISADEFGVTALMVAGSAGNDTIARALCEIGADPNAMSDAGETPLINTVRDADDDAPQDTASIARRQAILEVLVRSGASLDVLGHQGCSALHWAIIFSQTALVERLLALGSDASVRLQDRPDDQTALELASSSRCRGTPAQRQRILELLAGSEPR